MRVRVRVRVEFGDMGRPSANLQLLFSACWQLLLVLNLVTNGVFSQTIVTYLPGFDGPLPFEMETGYVNVDSSNGVYFFYTFFKSESNPAEDPLIFWFTGGPGCAALNAVTHNIGPFIFLSVIYNGTIPTLLLNPYSYTKVSSMVFIDSPVGSGFSYSTTSQGSASSDTNAAEQSYTFIRKWLKDHPDFLSHSVYVGGDAYAGIPVPIILQHISDGIQAGSEPVINLKGYLLGNPNTDTDMETNSQVPYAHGMALISDELFESAETSCGGDYANIQPNNLKCKNDLQNISYDVEGIWKFHILERNCCQVVISSDNEIIRSRSSLELNSLSRIPQDLFDDCRRYYGNTLSSYWANDERVRKALNIRKGTVKEWFWCNPNGINYTKDVKSVISYHSNLSKQGYRSLIYSGDHDFAVTFLSTQEWIKSLNYSISDDWRPWVVQEQVAGYTRTYTNKMTFATVKGAGHTAAEQKPKECLDMVRRWFSHEPL